MKKKLKAKGVDLEQVKTYREMIQNTELLDPTLLVKSLVTFRMTDETSKICYLELKKEIERRGIPIDYIILYSKTLILEEVQKLVDKEKEEALKNTTEEPYFPLSRIWCNISSKIFQTYSKMMEKAEIKWEVYLEN